MTDADHRLATHVVPEHYRIEMAPDIDRAVFEGSVEITVRIAEHSDEIVCNAAELEIHNAEITADGASRQLSVRIDEAAERLHLSAPGGFAAGAATLRIGFSGVLNDRLCGFYRSVYTDDDGTEHTIATTQFQSTDARRAFPCWDEPAFKAVFETSLICDPDLLAVSNSAEAASEILDDGRRRTTFAPTIPMSTYLVAFVVGRLEASGPVEVDGVPIRVIHRPGQGHLCGHALQTAGSALHWLADYYDIAYPGDKVDLVAVPDFAFGAMENLGCVTFRETLLLVDPATAAQADMQRAADVINHELAHMWFGDLVTMQWWEGIWLNEAFATFMEISCTDAFRPDWRAWETFARARSEAFGVDALAATRPIEYPVRSPADAEGMYDLITYEKGAAVVKMLERHLGADVFRDGVRRYLRTHQYANTATTDLWDALEEVSAQPVRTMMDAWIFQGGHPLVEATPTSHGLRLTQSHFTLEESAADDRLWAVPLAVRAHSGEQRLLLNERAAYLTGITGTGSAPTAINDDGFGFFRSRIHSDAMPEADTGDAGSAESGDVGLGAGGPSTTRSGASGRNAAALSAAGLHSLVDDEWALTLSGRRSAAEFTSLIEEVAALPGQGRLPGRGSQAAPSGDDAGGPPASPGDDLSGPPAVDDAGGPPASPGDDLNVWQAIAAALDPLMRLVASRQQAAQALQARIVAMCRPALERIGPEPSSHDDDRTLELRATLVRVLGAVADDPDTIAACRSRFEAAPGAPRTTGEAPSTQQPAAGQEPSLAAADLTVVAHHMDAEGFERLRDRWLHPSDPVSEQRHLRAMADTGRIELVDRLLADISSGAVRTQDAPYVLARALANPKTGRHVWDFVETEWDDLIARFPSNSISRMLAGIVALDSAADSRRVGAFLAEHPVAQAQRQIAQLLERQQVNAAFRARELARYTAWLSAAGEP